MLRKISVGGKVFTLDLVSADGGGNVRFRLDAAGTAPEDADPSAGPEAERSASAIEVMPRVWSVLMDGRSFEARVIADNGEVIIEIDGERYPVVIEDPRKHRKAARTGGGGGRAAVTAPMPGKVVRVLAAEGDSVVAGQGLVVIEAMKMQNELQSPRDGRVASLPVRQGDTVAAGAVLAVVE
jgi:biotin carboxyl carrier protein